MGAFSSVFNYLLIFLAAAALYGEEPGPYLLPEDHPIKASLDLIFSKKDVLKSCKTMEKAGFINPFPKAFTQLVVTKHPSVPGYIFKVYLDCQRNIKNRPIHYFWIKRIKGAELVRNTIHTYGLEDRFKVPRKYIYALPERSPEKKEYILVEEDMLLVGRSENENLWQSVTEEILDSVYLIIEENGMDDCAKPDNIPFSIDGKIAFVDTASYHKWPVAYHKLNSHLSPEMRKYWKLITSQ